MPKDHENISLPDLGPLTPTEPQGFAPEQMVRCEQCLRANPPTRVNCLYCGAALAFDEHTADLQKPSLAPLERWQTGHNNILIPTASLPDPKALEEASALLKLSIDQLETILQANRELPLARTATIEEALLIERRLKDCGLITKIISDSDLRIEEFPTVRLRAANFEEKGLLAHPTGGGPNVFVLWSELTLLVRGRLLMKSLEVRERKSAKAENQLIDSSQTFADEAVIDLYTRRGDSNLRIAAHGFDFSSLGDRKGLLAEENFNSLIDTLRHLTPQLSVDDSYSSVKRALEYIWPSESQTASRGWRRDRPGKYSLGAVTEVSNETQFTRYSRLRYHLSQSGSS